MIMLRRTLSKLTVSCFLRADVKAVVQLEFCQWQGWELCAAGLLCRAHFLIIDPLAGSLNCLCVSAAVFVV
jgi:hypothetical protein